MIGLAGAALAVAVVGAAVVASSGGDAGGADDGRTVSGPGTSLAPDASASDGRPSDLADAEEPEGSTGTEGSDANTTGRTGTRTGDPTAEPAPQSDTGTTASTTPPPPRPTTLEAWEARWATERQAIVDTLDAAPYGLGDDGVLRGPGGFTLDTNQCPDGWSDRAGIEGDTVSITHYAPLGALTTAGDLALGSRLHLEQVNDRGGIGPDGLRVEMTVTDDGFVATTTAQLVDEALDPTSPEPEPFAISTTGSANLDAVNGRVNDHCVPLLLGIALGDGVGQPTEHPWTTGLPMTLTTEAHLWAAWIEAEFPDGATVAALVMDHELGRTYERAFIAAVDRSPAIERVDVVHHAHTSATVAAEMAEIAALEPDVFVAMTSGNPCLSAVEEAARLGLDQTTGVRFLPSICQQPASYLQPAGDDGDGWLVLGGGVRDISGISESDREGAGGTEDAWVESVRSELDGLGVDWTQGQIAQGYALRGWAMHQVLEIAASLDGGLTRTNLILAQRGLREMTHPALHAGVRFRMNGVDDPFLIEGSQVARYDATTHRWIVEGVLDLSR